MTTIIFFILYCKRSDDIFLMSWEVTTLNHCMDVRDNCMGNNDTAHAMINFLHAVNCKDDGNEGAYFLCCIARGEDKNGWLGQRSTRLRQATTNQIFVALQEQATIAKQQHCQRDDCFYILYCIARSYDNDNIFFSCIAGSSNDGWLQQSHKIAEATTILFHQCGSTTLTVAKAQGPSNKIECNAMTTMSTMWQAFFCVVLQRARTIKNKGKGRTKWLPRKNQIFMLSFVWCNNNHIVPRNDQQCKYSKVGYGKNAGKGVYVA